MSHDFGAVICYIVVFAIIAKKCGTQFCYKIIIVHSWDYIGVYYCDKLKTTTVNKQAKQ